MAQKCGHISMKQKDFLADGNNVEREVSNYLMGENLDCYGDFSDLMNYCDDISSILDNVPQENDESEPEGAQMYFSGPSSISSEVLKSDECDMEPSIERLKKMKCEGKNDTDRVATSMEQSGNTETKLEVDGMYIDMKISSQEDSALEDKTEEVLETPQVVENSGSGNLRKRFTTTNLGFKTNYEGIRASISSNTDGKSLKNQDYYDGNRRSHQGSDSYHVGSLPSRKNFSSMQLNQTLLSSY